MAAIFDLWHLPRYIYCTFEMSSSNTVSQMKECDFDYLDVVQGRLIKAWFGVSKFCSTTALREAIRWKRASEVVFCQLRHGARMSLFVLGEDTQSIPFGKHHIRRCMGSGRNKEIISLVRRTSVTSNLLVRHSHHLSNK